MESSKKEDGWVITVKSSLAWEIGPYQSHHGLIHGVPKSLLSRNKRQFYIPQAICFGPYHFRQDVGNDMELLKSEVARKMHDKIISNGGLESVVEMFKEKAFYKKIKESYAKEIKVSSEVLAWMTVRDACFVLEVLNRFQEGEDRNKGDDGKKSKWPHIDRVLSRHHPLLTEIVKDMFKMENQLPFWVLEESRNYKIPRSNNYGHVDDVWFESALKNLSPVKVGARQGRKFESKDHILQLLHEYIVDNIRGTETSSTGRKDDSVISDESAEAKGKKKDDSDESAEAKEKKKDDSDESATKRSKSRCMKLIIPLILLVFSPVLVIFFIWGFIFVICYCTRNLMSGKGTGKSGSESQEHVPTVEELKRVGVKFKNSEGSKTMGVSGIKFEEQSATLYLPKIDIDNRSEVILRNLIALEIFSQDEEKPITRYALLMNDLINTGADVSMLRGKGIITSKLGSDDEIAQLWNSMLTATEMPRYDIIDGACRSINLYREKWWKILWAQFIMLHCSKPWLFLSLLAGVTLLLLTFIQVVCLFESCQLK